MKALKPHKKKSWGIFYRVNRVCDISKDLIATLEWPENICLGISFKPMPLAALLEKKLRFPVEYKATLCCYSQGRGVKKIYPAIPSFGVESRPPKNFSELKRLQIKMALDFARRQKGGLNKQFRKGLNEYVQKSLGKTKSLILMRKERPEGLFSLLPAVGGNVQPVKYDGITWHQFPKNISTKERQSAYYQVSNWLQVVARLQVAVKISPKDIAFAKFLAGMDFAVSSVQFSRIPGRKSSRRIGKKAQG